MPYAEDDMLMLSGIQHYAFCPRQWALIHIDQQWGDNLLTTEGNIMHQHVDDPFYRQKMGDHICLRSVSLASKELGLYGISISEGAIFYGEIRRRTEVVFTDELRSAVRAYAAAMHDIFERGIVPSS